MPVTTALPQDKTQIHVSHKIKHRPQTRYSTQKYANVFSVDGTVSLFPGHCPQNVTLIHPAQAEGQSRWYPNVPLHHTVADTKHKMQYHTLANSILIGAAIYL